MEKKLKNSIYDIDQYDNYLIYQDDIYDIKAKKYLVPINYTIRSFIIWVDGVQKRIDLRKDMDIRKPKPTEWPGDKVSIADARIIRSMYHQDGKSIRAIAQETDFKYNIVQRVISDERYDPNKYDEKTYKLLTSRMFNKCSDF